MSGRNSRHCEEPQGQSHQAGPAPWWAGHSHRGHSFLAPSGSQGKWEGSPISSQMIHTPISDEHAYIPFPMIILPFSDGPTFHSFTGCACTGMYRYMKIEMPCPLRKLFSFPLVKWNCFADGIISFVRSLASLRDVFVKGKLPNSITGWVFFRGMKVCWIVVLVFF